MIVIVIVVMLSGRINFYGVGVVPRGQTTGSSYVRVNSLLGTVLDTAHRAQSISKRQPQCKIKNADAVNIVTKKGILISVMINSEGEVSMQIMKFE